MNVRNAQNLSMLCDFYELTMSNGYFRNGYKDRITYFDLFFRQVPDGGGFAIAAGLEQVVEYITNLHFSDEDIDYLRSRGIFCEEFLQYLRDFRFTGDIWAVPEGTPVFPREPLVTVRAPAVEAQLLETFMLMQINLFNPFRLWFFFSFRCKCCILYLALLTFKQKLRTCSNTFTLCQYTL